MGQGAEPLGGQQLDRGLQNPELGWRHNGLL
jgi:hypothetical protein